MVIRPMDSIKIASKVKTFVFKLLSNPKSDEINKGSVDWLIFIFVIMSDIDSARALNPSSPSIDHHDSALVAYGRTWDKLEQPSRCSLVGP